MTAAIVFGILTVFFALLLLYYIDLIFFFLREKKHFERAGEEKSYLQKLEEKHKRSKHPQKKNYYLYLICLACTKQGEEKKALRLSAFLKNDPILGVASK